MPLAAPRAFDQVVDLAGGDAVHVGLHHHRVQGPVDPPAPLQQRREEAALAQLRDRQLDVPRRGRDQLRAMPVALRRASLGALMRAGADDRGRFRFDQLLQDPLQRGADRVGHLPGLERGEQFGQVRLAEGHRWLLLREPGKEHVEDHAGGPPAGGPYDLHHLTGHERNARGHS
jgi:hypothetical protein